MVTDYRTAMFMALESVRDIGENNGGGWAMKLDPTEMTTTEWYARAGECEDNLRSLLKHHKNLTQLITDAMIALYGARRRIEMEEERRKQVSNAGIN